MNRAVPLVSVVICTQNRAELLAAAIASIAEPQPPVVSYEIIVVDNGSVDETAMLVQALPNPHLVYRHEATPGLSRARNTGWQAARGQIVAYLDDDATAFPGWLDAVAKGFAGDPGASAIGGPVRPVWHAPRPHWLTDEIAHALTILDWGPATHRLAIDRQWLVGANMAFRRGVLAETGGFDLRLGRRENLLLSNEETLLLRQIDRLGHGILYWPEMQVHHPVPQARLDPRWLVQRHFWQGISDARVWEIEAGADPQSRADQAAAAVVSSPRACGAVRDAAARFTQRCRAARQAGLIAGLLAGAAG